MIELYYLFPFQVFVQLLPRKSLEWNWVVHKPLIFTALRAMYVWFNDWVYLCKC